VGYDPNTLLQPAYEKIIETLSFNPKQTYVVNNEPFETAVLADNDFDIVFTSPPFFDLEQYSDEETQSIKRYPRYDDWLQYFLFASLRNAFNALKPNGYLAVHISDNMSYQPCQPMIDFVKQELDSTYLGVIGLAGERKKYRPVWVWQKQT
jgi:hypothetical protein